MGTTSTNLAVYSLRVERERLDRLSEIAATEHRTLVQKLRVMIEAEIAAHETVAEIAPRAT